MIIKKYLVFKLSQKFILIKMLYMARRLQLLSSMEFKFKDHTLRQEETDIFCLWKYKF